MRIAVCSDLHANLDAVKEVWNSLHDVDRIICLGDMVGIGPDPREVLEMVLDDPRFSWVMGNHDVNTRDGTNLGPLQHVPRKPHHEWVRKEIGDMVDEMYAPMVMEMELGGSNLSFMHRHPEDCGSKVPYFDRPFPEVLDDFYRDVRGDMIFFGHTHIPLMVKGEGNRFYMNPGSVGAENKGIAKYIVLDDENGKKPGPVTRRVSYDTSGIRERLKKKEVPYREFIIEHFF